MFTRAARNLDTARATAGTVVATDEESGGEMRGMRFIRRLVALAVLSSLAGVGAMAPASPAAAVDTQLSFGPAQWYFGERPIGVTTTIDFSVYNFGPGSIGPLYFFGGGTPSTQFDLTQTCAGATLTTSYPGYSCDVSVSFTPDGPGAFFDALSFTVSPTANEADGETFTMQLAGKGGPAPDGTITGTITPVNAAPGSQFNVYVTSLDGSAKHQFHNEPASYSVDVPPGEYCVSFGIGPWDGTVVSYPGKRHCLDGITPVTVTSAATTAGIDATLTLSAITGTVRDHLGAVAPSTFVSARVVGGTADNYDSADGTGLYEIGNLPGGTYCVSAAGGTADPTDGPCRAGSRRVELAAGATAVGVDLALAAPGAGLEFPGAIAGKVTDQANIAQAGRTVRLEPLFEGGYYNSADTAADGTYTITGLPAGPYCVFVTDDGSALAGEHYNDKTSCDTADPVTVGNTVVSGIDFALSPGGSISGLITDPLGAPITYGTVFIRRFDDYSGVEADIQPDGTYTAQGLSTGTYCVVARAYFNDLPQRAFGGGASCERGAAPVTVVAGSTTSGVDIQLWSGGRITGTVTFPPGFVPGHDDGYLLISTRDEDGEQSGYVNVDLTGHYETERLAPGNYCLDARPPSPSLLVYKRLGSLRPDGCEAGTITVTDGADTVLDFTMELGGSISGWVISPNGYPDRDPNPDTVPWAGENDRVRPDGSYRLTGVPAGTYCVSIWGFGLWVVQQVYNGALDCDTGFTPVAVTAGQNTGNINFFMQTGGELSGTITHPPVDLDEMGAGDFHVEYRRLDAAQPVITDSSYSQTSTTSEFGRDLPPGTYCVLVRPHSSTGLANRAYGGTPSCAGATPVVVPHLGAVEDVDITLTPQIYYGLANPARVLDTRPGVPTIDGLAAGDGAVAGGTVREVTIGGRAGVPAGAASVALNVTATNTTGPGYLTLFACGQPAPTASNVNFTGAGQTTPNAVIVKLGSGGKVCIYALTTTDVVIDVAGYFPSPDGFTPLDNPARLLDTRPGEPVAAGGTGGTGAVAGGTVREVQIGNLAGVPSNAASVALNVTATNTTGPGYLSIFPCGQAPPTASNVNFTGAGLTTPNAVVSKLGTDGKVCVYALTTADVIVDVAGYFADSQGFTPLTNPARLLDTRPGEPTVDGVAAGGGAIAGGTVREVPVGARAGVPSGAASVALNVTATNTTGPGYLSLFPCGQTPPTASNVNFTAAGQTTPNAVIARLGTDGKVCVYALTTTDVVIDVAGFLPEGDGPLVEYGAG
jgi:hypothetical protein